MLLEAGADPTCADYRGMCALDFASTSGVLRRWKKARYGKKKVRAGEVWEGDEPRSWVGDLDLVSLMMQGRGWKQPVWGRAGETRGKVGDRVGQGREAVSVRRRGRGGCGEPRGTVV